MVRRSTDAFTNTPDKLPFDHHELIAMVAPRALLAIESTNVPRMRAQAARGRSRRAPHLDRARAPYHIGATEENVSHCVRHEGFTPDLEAFVERTCSRWRRSPLTAGARASRSTKPDIWRSRFASDEATRLPWETRMLQ